MCQNRPAIPLERRPGDGWEKIEDPWQVLCGQRDALVTELHSAAAQALAAKEVAARKAEAAGRIAEAQEIRSSEGPVGLPYSRCQRCASRSCSAALPIPEDLPGSSSLALFGNWSRALRALRTPHCPNCGTVTFGAKPGRFGSLKSLVTQAQLGAPLAWEAGLQPCACCCVRIAGDAIACPHCGSTCPHGGYISQPRLQRCVRCGATVSSDAGLCISCGTASFRHPGLFSRPPTGDPLRLVGCLGCGRDIAADALLCIHCGIAFSVEKDEKPGGSHRRIYITAVEAADAAEASMAAGVKDYTKYLKSDIDGAFRGGGTRRPECCDRTLLALTGACRGVELKSSGEKKHSSSLATASEFMFVAREEANACSHDTSGDGFVACRRTDAAEMLESASSSTTSSVPTTSAASFIM